MQNKNLSQKQKEKLFEIIKNVKKEINNTELIGDLNLIESYILENKFGLNYEKHLEAVYELLEDHVPVFVEDNSRKIIKNKNDGINFILEGDNLHSLYLLQKTHNKSIDVIYIDPPYNTGAKDWKYNNNFVDKNDGFRHSKWLSMMSERLKLSKKLLKDDGVLICAIDENELATLYLLLEDLFGYSYVIDIVTVIHNPRGIQGDNFSYVNEYALFVYKRGLKAIEARDLDEDEISLSNLRNWGGESMRHDAANCFYPIYVKDNKIVGFGDDITSEDIHPEQTSYDEETGIYSIFPIDISGVERKWRYARQTVESIVDLLHVRKGREDRLEILIGKTTAKYKTVWTDKKFDANEYGTKLINAMVPENDFDFPKSLYTVYECIHAVVKDKPNAIVLDFFAGSGTTGHAVLKLNNDLGGNRNFILCTNNDIGDKKEREILKLYPNAKSIEELYDTDIYREYEEKYGIARSITFPRMRSAIEGYYSIRDSRELLFEKNINKGDITNKVNFERNQKQIEKIINKHKSDYTKIDTMIDDGKIKIFGRNDKKDKVKGIDANILFFKTKMIKKINDEEELYNLLLNHTEEMVKLKYSKNILNTRYKIFIDEDEMLEFLEKYDTKEKIKMVFYAPYILLSTEEENAFKMKGIELVEVPKDFFKEELQEVGEVW